jgi:putative cardiolipin synthase
MRVLKCNTCLARVVLVVLFLSGCVSLPERELENSFKYQRLKHSEQSLNKPIRSAYQDAADRAMMIEKAGGAEQFVSLLELGDDALLARVHLIRAARRSIDLQTFIWRDDPTSRFLFDELVAAAERGVLVRVLIDGLNIPAEPEQLALMARAHRNLEVCLYKPLSWNSKSGRIGFWKNLMFKARHMNRRMHNKLLLIDGRIGIVGGRNYGDKYYDRNREFLFRDRDVIVAGPSAWDMQESFELFWQDKRAVFLTQLKDVQKKFNKLPNGGDPLLAVADRGLFEEIDRLANEYLLEKHRPRLKIYEADLVEFVADTPRKFRIKDGAKKFNELVIDAFKSAEYQLVYQTPYLIYDRRTRKAFQALHEKNSTFRIIASSNSLAAADHLHVYALSFKHRKALYKKSGIDIYESKPYPGDREQYVYNYSALKQLGKGPRLCIHSKSLTVDGKIAMIGSHNFDPRSAKLNTECGLFIRDEEVAKELERLILNACKPQNSWTVGKLPKIPLLSYFSGIIGAISTAMPIFDVWPYRYTSNYELNYGGMPVSPRDEKFHENYYNVGQFPEVKDSSSEIKTKLIKTFFGWTRPLM